MRIPCRNGWRGLGGRLVLALVAAVVVPACGKTKMVVGTPGPQGPDGPSGANPPAQWADPVNISQQVVASNGYDAYGQQAVFTPDGRLHVVYFAYDYSDTDEDQLFYTSAAAPYTAWDAPVRLTDTSNSPLTFDLAAAADNSVHVVFARNDYSVGSYTYLVYTRNTAALRLAFTETQIYEETYDTDEIFSAQILMRGTTAHVVWTGYNNNGYYYYYYSNSGATWPLDDALGVGTNRPTIVGETNSGYDVDSDHYVFTSDSAGNFHLVYLLDDGSYRYVLYRPLPLQAASLGQAQQLNDEINEQIAMNTGAPIVQFDGSDNVYVFWRRGDSNTPPAPPYRAILCNIKGASAGTFQVANAAVVTDDPQDDEIPGIWPDSFHRIFDVQVASDGRIHAAWKMDDSSYGTVGLYPLYYRTKDPGLSPGVGWHDVQAAAWLLNPTNSSLWDGGICRSVFVRPAQDGTVHVFYSDVERIALVGETPELCHSYLPAGGTTWYSTGSLSRPTVQNVYPNKLGWTYFLDAGIEEDGSPYALFASDPAGIFYSSNGDVRYTHYWAGEWAFGTDVNGPEHATTYDDFWVGQDGAGKLHAIWMQEVDPFDNSDYYDLMHSDCPVSSETFWTPRFEQYNP